MVKMAEKTDPFHISALDVTGAKLEPPFIREQLVQLSLQQLCDNFRGTFPVGYRQSQSQIAFVIRRTVGLPARSSETLTSSIHRRIVDFEPVTRPQILKCGRDGEPFSVLEKTTQIAAIGGNPLVVYQSELSPGMGRGARGRIKQIPGIFVQIVGVRLNFHRALFWIDQWLSLFVEVDIHFGFGKIALQIQGVAPL